MANVSFVYISHRHLSVLCRDACLGCIGTVCSRKDIFITYFCGLSSTVFLCVHKMVKHGQMLLYLSVFCLFCLCVIVDCCFGGGLHCYSF